MSTLIQLTEYLHAISRAVKKLICCHMLLGSEEETVRFHGSFSPPLPQKVWGEFFPKKKSFPWGIFWTNLWKGANLKFIE